MRLGVTGHQRLARPEDWLWIQDKFDELLQQITDPLVGFTSLAVGTDQLFAELILKRGGSFTAVVPFAGYELKFAEGHDQQAYERLLAQASAVEVLSASTSNREAYFKAGKQVVHRCEILIAVWDGKPAAGLGGTADVVAYAQQYGRQIRHIDTINRVVKEISYV